MDVGSIVVDNRLEVAGSFGRKFFRIDLKGFGKELTYDFADYASADCTKQKVTVHESIELRGTRITDIDPRPKGEQHFPIETLSMILETVCT